MNTAILPPIGYRVPVGHHWFVQAQRNGGSEIQKPPFLIGVLIGLLDDDFFFVRRPAATFLIAFNGLFHLSIAGSNFLRNRN